MKRVHSAVKEPKESKEPNSTKRQTTGGLRPRIHVCGSHCPTLHDFIESRCTEESKRSEGEPSIDLATKLAAKLAAKLDAGLQVFANADSSEFWLARPGQTAPEGYVATEASSFSKLLSRCTSAGENTEMTTETTDFFRFTKDGLDGDHGDRNREARETATARLWVFSGIDPSDFYLVDQGVRLLVAITDVGCEALRPAFKCNEVICVLVFFFSIYLNISL
jgi:hypothetical protein